jgi:hypothetical protein
MTPDTAACERCKGRGVVPDTILGESPCTACRSVRLSVNINAETSAFLREYAARKGVTITEAVRRAVAVLKFVTDETDAGNRLVAGDREVHFVG